MEDKTLYIVLKNSSVHPTSEIGAVQYAEKLHKEGNLVSVRNERDAMSELDAGIAAGKFGIPDVINTNIGNYLVTALKIRLK